MRNLKVVDSDRGLLNRCEDQIDLAFWCSSQSPDGGSVNAATIEYSAFNKSFDHIGAIEVGAAKIRPGEVGSEQVGSY